MVEFDPKLNRYEERWNDWRDENPDIVRLRNRLLKIGGDEVVPNYEPDLNLLLNKGRLINPIEIIHFEMDMSQCHRNAKSLYLNDDSVTEIGTGWALSDDGLWRQHSWAMRGDELVETTVIREKYYGIFLEGEPLEEFLKTNI